MCTPMFLAALFTRAKRWKQKAIKEQKDKQNVVHTQNGINYSALKKGSPVTWYNMDDLWVHVKWNKPVKKDKYCMTPLIWGIWSSQIIETESGMIVTKGWGRGIKGNHCIMGTECQFHKTKRVLEMFHNNVNILNFTELYTQKWFKWCILCVVFFLPQFLRS